MFVGAINSTVRKFLAHNAQVFDGAAMVVGCSGNFTSEAVISQYAKPASVHSNDVSLYSCMVGRWLTGQSLEFQIVDLEYAWLQPHLNSDITKLASLMVLSDMLEFEPRRHDHERRMYRNYQEAFPGLVDTTCRKLKAVNIHVDTFFEGDVFDHFERHANDPDAIFCCYAPTYAGGYEKIYARLDQIVRWDEPLYPLLDDEGRDVLLAWMRQRKYLWYDDRPVPGLEPVMESRSGRKRTVYLYSNVLRQTAFFTDDQPGPLPNLPLAGEGLEITSFSAIWLERIKTTELARFKDAFLSKRIQYGQGMWAFSVFVDGKVVGFLEYHVPRYGRDGIYLMADFAVPGTPYRRLSKLVLALAIAGETRQALERINEIRLHGVFTTAFTDKPVSMKYRGVLNLLNRGETDEGEKFLNYGAEFNAQTWQETLAEWLTRHGSIRW